MKFVFAFNFFLALIVICKAGKLILLPFPSNHIILKSIILIEHKLQ